MPKAEVGSTKHLAKQMKAKGLQRLRWYCQICEKQCRDENGFKQHTLSEGHVRAMLLVGEDPKRVIRDYSRQFQRDFLQLLKTGHGEKKVHMNQFYQEYIRDKQHIHMNSTHWPSLTEFAKHLGREGICRVEEGERGLEIQWIDDSAEAIRRREEIKTMEKRAKGDEEVEARLLEQQIRRAREAEREKVEKRGEEKGPEGGKLEDFGAVEPTKVSMSLKGKAGQASQKAPDREDQVDAVPIESVSTAANSREETSQGNNGMDEKKPDISGSATPSKVSLSLAPKSKTANPLAKKNPFAKKRDAFVPEPEKKMSNAERIMKEEMERKRSAEERGYSGGKRQRLG